MALEFHQLTVAAVVEETADSRSFVLDVPPALRERFAYWAGQFVTIELPWNGFAIRRSYSLSSAPGLDPALRITVKRVEGGRMSNRLIDEVKAGQVLRVAAPDGSFVLDPATGARPLVLLGGGSGITPLISILKAALAGSARPIRLVYANRDRASVILRHELDALARAHPERLQLHYHHDAERGLLGAEDLRELLHADGDHYVCGPAPFMDTVVRALDAAGIPADRRYFERFASILDPDRRAALARQSADARPAPASFVVRLAGTAHTVAYPRGLSLLTAAQQAGVKAPSSCEDGYCGSCRAQLVTGQVHMLQVKTILAKLLSRYDLALGDDPMVADLGTLVLGPRAPLRIHYHRRRDAFAR